MPQSPSPSSLEQVRQALRRAYYLGQTYWQQADSESPKQHAKADETRAKFEALVEEACAALSAVEALGQQAEPVAEVRLIAGKVASCRERDGHGLPDGLHTLYVGPYVPVERPTLAEAFAPSMIPEADALFAQLLDESGGSGAALQQQEAGSGWRTIESAPQDRSEILAWFPKLKLGDDGDLTDEVVGGAMAIVAFSEDSWDEPQWLDASGAYYFGDWSFAPDPTHWQPLPAPPGACAPSPTEPKAEPGSPVYPTTYGPNCIPQTPTASPVGVPLVHQRVTPCKHCGAKQGDEHSVTCPYGVNAPDGGSDGS